MDAKEKDDCWRDLARETVRNLSRLVEDAQAVLRQAEDRLQRLEDDNEQSDTA